MYNWYYHLNWVKVLLIHVHFCEQQILPSFTFHSRIVWYPVFSVRFPGFRTSFRYFAKSKNLSLFSLSPYMLSTIFIFILRFLVNFTNLHPFKLLTTYFASRRNSESKVHNQRVLKIMDNYGHHKRQYTTRGYSGNTDAVDTTGLRDETH